MHPPVARAVQGSKATAHQRQQKKQLRTQQHGHGTRQPNKMREQGVAFPAAHCAAAERKEAEPRHESKRHYYWLEDSAMLTPRTSALKPCGSPASSQLLFVVWFV